MSRKKFALIGLLAAIASTIVVGAFFMTLHYYFFKEPTRGGDFTLQSNKGAWNLSDHSKDLSIIYFGYSKCPDVCPTTFSAVSKAHKNLNESEVSSMNVIFVSVDYDHDSPESTQTYIENFGNTFIGLTGTKEQIKLVTEKFKSGFSVEQNSKSYLGYSVSHSDRLFFLDRKGIVIDEIPQPRDSQVILETIRRNL